ncbi:Argonaute-binding protein 1 [Trichoderma ghanense]|uniref:Argonaute-binding protein 1 n=1 Tax=Trichoderma ghanense TaxID=65468 RepID=A0ABY2GZR3_9HYPO
MKANTLAVVALGLFAGESLGQSVPPIVSSLSAQISSALASIESQASSVATSLTGTTGTGTTVTGTTGTGTTGAGTTTSSATTQTTTVPVSTTVTSVQSGTTEPATTIPGTTNSQTTRAATTIPGTTISPTTRVFTTTSASTSTSTGLAIAPTADAKLLAPILGAAAAMASAAPDGEDTIMKDATMSDPMPEIDESVAPTKHLLPGQVEGASEDDADDDAQDDAAGASIIPAQLSGPRKKRKRSKKTTASRGPTALPKNRGNGFEEYFADPPMTPVEAMQEKQEIYAPDIPFERYHQPSQQLVLVHSVANMITHCRRIESCIQRFRSRRRIQARRATYLNDYLFLGGVDTNPSAYTGLDQKDLKQLTPAQRREATARDVVYEGSGAGDRFYDGDKTKWAVDFAGVAAGFFSTRLIALTGLHPKPMEEAISVVENFLRYVLHHDVCPEYEDNVKEALNICQMARDEWTTLNTLQTALPGVFNPAATELFVKFDPDSWDSSLFNVPEGFDAKSVFYSSIAMLEDDKLFEHLAGKAVELVDQYECALEITEVHLPTEEVIERFKKLAITAAGNKTLRLMPLGKLTLKPVTIEDGWVQQGAAHPLQGKEIDLYFEQNILASLKPGMKMALEIGDLGADVRFVKSIRKIVPTFYTFLPQELMVQFKIPQKNDRPAPSVHNPTLEDDDAVEE